MALKILKSYTKSTRGTVLVKREDLWKGKSLKSLTVGTHSTGGRNNVGRITSRHRGAGHKQRYREIDFYRKKDDMKAIIERIEYDPNRSAHVALVKYEDGVFNYILDVSPTGELLPISIPLGPTSPTTPPHIVLSKSTTKHFFDFPIIDIIIFRIL